MEPGAGLRTDGRQAKLEPASRSLALSTVSLHWVAHPLNGKERMESQAWRQPRKPPRPCQDASLWLLPLFWCAINGSPTSVLQVLCINPPEFLPSHAALTLTHGGFNLHACCTCAASAIDRTFVLVDCVPCKCSCHQINPLFPCWYCRRGTQPGLHWACKLHHQFNQPRIPHYKGQRSHLQVWMHL